MLSNKKWLYFALSGPILAAIVVIAYFLFFQPKSNLHPLEIGENTVYVSIADTEEARQQGLSGKDGLSQNEGMLFIFPVEGRYPFWMKDMRFAIDMLWIDKEGKIIYIKQDVVPATYPQTFQPPSGLAKYVLELPEGYTREHGIKVGDSISLDLQ